VPRPQPPLQRIGLPGQRGRLGLLSRSSRRVLVSGQGEDRDGPPRRLARLGDALREAQRMVGDDTEVLAELRKLTIGYERRHGVISPH